MWRTVKGEGVKAHDEDGVVDGVIERDEVGMT